MMNRVIIVKNFPPNATESSIVAALKVYGSLKSFGMHKNLGFADFVDPEKAINSTIVVGGWKLDLFYGESTTKKPQTPAKTTFEQEQNTFSENDLSDCHKYKVSGFRRDISNIELFEELTAEFGVLACFSRFYIWSKHSLPISEKFHLEYISERECYSCFRLNDSDFQICIFCNTEREFCKICKFENIPKTNYCSGCGKKNALRNKKSL
jgi:hypothetical protein